MKKPRPPAKTLAFRFPLAARQRSDIKECRHRPGTPAEKLTPDSLVITGTWKKKDALVIAPVFPGTMRFMAADRQHLPKPNEVIFDGDHIPPAYLQSLGAFSGMLVIEVQPLGMLKQMGEAGTIPVVGVAPSLACYGPISLGESFLREALLDPKGLDPSIVKGDDGKALTPGSKVWQAAVLTQFLSGDYRPMLQAGATLDADDAEKLPMPSIVMGKDFAGRALTDKDTFALAMTFAASNGAADTPADLASPTIETVPADAFLRHVARKMREPVSSQKVNDAVLKAVLEDEDSAEPWTSRFLASLSALGFGAKAEFTPPEMVVREFQFAASQDKLAKLIDPTAPPSQIARRDFRHLEQTLNHDTYKGFMSGLADRRTRALIANWTRASLRNPLLMPVFLGEADDYVAPAGDPVGGAEDVWNRHEMKIGLGRVFAADFSRADLVNGRIAHGDLRPVGRYKSYGPGGPVTMAPTTPSVRADSAEIKPLTMFGIDEAPLIAALADRDKAAPELVAKASSFRVIRAVSEIESLGYLDTINAYDGAGLSLAPYQWAMAGTEKKPGETSELGGFASVFADLHAKGLIAEDAFASLGLKAVGGRQAGFGKFVGTLKFLDYLGKPRAMNADGPTDYMPSWRSVYRWQQMGRLNASYARAAYAFALKRLAIVFQTKVGVSPFACDKRAHGPDGPTIGSVFTSELLMAMIVRWHVKAPAGVIQWDNLAAPSIRSAYTVAAQAVSAMDQATWKDPAIWEASLKAALLAALNVFLTKPENHKHVELRDNMAELENPTWLDDTPVVVPTGNIYGYSLKPLLRILNGSFKLAPQEHS